MDFATTWYGSEQTGLVSGYAFSVDGIGRPISSVEADAWLSGKADDTDGQEFIWLHFHIGTTGTEKWLKSHLKLSDLFFDNLAEVSRTTRVEYAGDALVATLNDVTYDFSFDPSEIKTLCLSVDRASW